MEAIIPELGGLPGGVRGPDGRRHVLMVLQSSLGDGVGLALDVRCVGCDCPVGRVTLPARPDDLDGAWARSTIVDLLDHHAWPPIRWRADEHGV